MQFSVRTSSTLSLLLALIGGLLLLAYPLGWEWAYRPFPDLPGTHIGTATGFFLLAVAQFAAFGGYQRLIVPVAISALIIALWRLIEIASGFTVLDGIQQMFIGADAYAPTMGRNSAITISALSAGYVLKQKSYVRSAQVMLAVAASYILVALTGYAFALENFFGEMSPITVALMSASAVGLIVRLSPYPPLKYIAARSVAGWWLRVSLVVTTTSIYALAWMALEYGSASAQVFPVAVVAGVAVQVALFLTGAVLIGRHDEAIAQHARDMEELASKAEAASVAKSRFLATMSHELRTPMSGILGMADLMHLSKLDDEQKRVMNLLVRSARSLLDLLNDILNSSKIEAGRLEIEHTPFRLSEVIEDLYNLFVPVASEKGLVFENRVPAQYQDAVIGDQQRLRQIITNFVNNAVKFTEKGGVTLIVDQDQMAGDDIVLRISVQDTGIGIPPGEIEKLFKPFTQADESTSRKYGGTGLGLTISRNLVELMGGDISVSSEPGKGSVFSFTVPLKADTSVSDGMVRGGQVVRQSASAVATRQTSALGSMGALKILLAEDNDALRFFISTMLSKFGHAVTVVENGEEAVRAFSANSYDILLMDMQMPVMDGMDAVRAIRGMERSDDEGRIPIIALTADIMTEHQVEYLAAGCDVIIGKPVDWNMLAVEMRRLCKTSQGKRDEKPAMPSSGPMETEGRVFDSAVISQLGELLGDDALDVALQSFVNDAARYWSDLDSARVAGNAEGVVRAAHSLKGLCLQFGADQAGNIAGAIQECGDPMKAAPTAELRKSLIEVTRILEKVTGCRRPRGPIR